MLNRHQSREVVLQTLFNLDFREGGKKDLKNLKNIYQYVLEEFYAEVKEDNYSEKVFFAVLENQEKIDEIIEKAATNWPLKKIDPIDRNILRLGIFEMIFFKDEVPPRVAMNEAIELAKSFGGKNSFKFISGVLGTIYKLSELEKNDKKDNIDSTGKKEELKNIPEKKRVGVAFFCEKNNEKYILMVHNIFGFWTLPKGDSLEEIERETGLKIKILTELGKVSIRASDHEKNTPIQKIITYSLSLSECQDLTNIFTKTIKNKGWVDALWVNFNKIQELKTYSNLKPILNKVFDYVK